MHLQSLWLTPILLMFFASCTSQADTEFADLEVVELGLMAPRVKTEMDANVHVLDAEGQNLPEAPTDVSCLLNGHEMSWREGGFGGIILFPVPAIATEDGAVAEFVDNQPIEDFLGTVTLQLIHGDNVKQASWLSPYDNGIPALDGLPALVTAGDKYLLSFDTSMEYIEIVVDFLSRVDRGGAEVSIDMEHHSAEFVVPQLYPGVYTLRVTYRGTFPAFECEDLRDCRTVFAHHITTRDIEVRAVEEIK